MGRSLHTKLYINIIIEVKNQIYDTLIWHRYIFNLVPLDGTKILLGQSAENVIDNIQYGTKLL